MRQYVRYWVLLTLCLLATLVQAATYRVNTNSQLNMRSQRSVNSEVVCKINPGSMVEGLSDTDEDGWIYITADGQKGYVKASYLQLVETEAPADGADAYIEKGKTAVAQFVQGILAGPRDGNKKLSWVVLGGALLIWVLLKFVRCLNTDLEDTNDEVGDWVHYVTPILVLFTSVFIFYYVIQMGTAALWFLFPSQAGGWGYVALNFVFFMYILINLCVGFFVAMKDIGLWCNCSFDLRVGLVGWALYILALIITIVAMKNWYDYVAYFLLALQGIQLIIFMCSVRTNKFIGILCASVLYLVGSSAIVLLTLPLIVIACILMVALVALIIMGKMSTGSESSSSGGSDIQQGPQEDPYDQVIRSSDPWEGDVKARSYYGLGADLQDEKGRLWKKEIDGSLTEVH